MVSDPPTGDREISCLFRLRGGWAAVILGAMTTASPSLPEYLREEILLHPENRQFPKFDASCQSHPAWSIGSAA